MNPIRVALAQLNTRVGDVAGNEARAAEAIRRAEDAGADVVVLPELTLSGYPAEDLLFRRSYLDAIDAALHRLARATGGVVALMGTPERADGALYNSIAVLHEGEVCGTYRKHRLPNYGVFDEARYFTSGTRATVLSLDGARMGLTVCEDIWYAGGPGARACREGGASLVLNPSASPFHAGKPADREALFGSYATDVSAHVLVANLVGGQDELVFDGHSLAIGPDGTVLARARGFEEDFLLFDVALPTVSTPVGPGVDLIKRPRRDRSGRPSIPSPNAGVPADARSATYDALCLGTRDYVHKNGFSHVVVGLSGGIDSALTAAIAADALGAEAVTGVGMPSPYSSPGSLTDAKELARRLGVSFTEIPIHAVQAAFLDALKPTFGGRAPDVTEENLQARIRGTLLMALSNKFGWLVLTTGNKSETAVGYSTLYGDTAGGFAVLKDVYKTTVFALARYRNERGEVIPEAILTKPPSAELRPDQRDTDSLPPYEVLDPILRAYVEADRPLAELLAEGADPETVARVVRLVDAAEHKRRQSPPGIKVTPRAFGKDRRMPIASAWRVGSATRPGP